MVNHGINVTQQTTSVSTPVVADVGVPFVVGAAPIQSAENPAKPGVPVLCTSWAETVEQLGYSDDWQHYTLCEFMYSHFKLYACQPVIFCNVLNPDEMFEVVDAADIATADHRVLLPIRAINDSSLVVKHDDAELAADKDYIVYYDGENAIIELLADSAAYGAESLNVAYKQVVCDKITANTIAMAFDAVDNCMSTAGGVIPDLLVAPGWSHDPVVAAVMATKAACAINGMFAAKALVDIDCTEDGATSYTEAVALKNAKNITDPTEIPCWPMYTLGSYKFHASTHEAGRMAATDTDNSAIPYESPSNKSLKIDGMCLADGTEVSLTLAQANVLNANGICTALNFMGGWVAWGNWTACYPSNTDVKDYFIPVSRMFDYVNNTLIKTFWTKLDKPMNRRLIDTILDSSNIWLNGLVGAGYLLGARVEMLDDENPLTNLMAGIIKLHVYMTPPSPAKQIDFVLEYDADYVESALQG